MEKLLFTITKQSKDLRPKSTAFSASSKDRRLRFLNIYDTVFEIYSLKSSSWKVLRASPTTYVQINGQGVSLKGNTYWLGEISNSRHLLICFDFTTEMFGPHMHLPFDASFDDTLALSGVREEQLAVLLQRKGTLRVKIWVTTKIEPKDDDDVSWSKLFVEVNMASLTGSRLLCNDASFFTDHKRRAAVVFDKDIAYIIGKNGYVKKVDLGESSSKEQSCWPLACSYVPSSVQMEQPAPRGKKKRKQIIKPVH